MEAPLSHNQAHSAKFVRGGGGGEGVRNEKK